MTTLRAVSTRVCLGLSAILLGSPTVSGQQPVQSVTSDTPAYCLQLLDKVSDLVRLSSGPAPEEVTYLSSEGQRMCDQGQTRGGILRLRRALMLMLQSAEQP